MFGKEFSRGEGRTRVSLLARSLGADLLVLIYNEHAHVGAVALAEYDQQNQRPSTSVLTRLGHKDDAVAQKAAHDICKATRRATCVAAGIHVNDITPKEMDSALENAAGLVNEFIAHIE